VSLRYFHNVDIAIVDIDVVSPKRFSRSRRESSQSVRYIQLKNDKIRDEPRAEARVYI